MKRLIAFVMMSAITAMVAHVDIVSATTITVNTTSMTGIETGDGLPEECSIYDAVVAARSDTSTNGCPAGDANPEGDTILLPSGTFDGFNKPVMSVSGDKIQIIGQGKTETILKDLTILNGGSFFFSLRDVELLRSRVTMTSTGSTSNTLEVAEVKMTGGAISIRQNDTSTTTSLLRDIEGVKDTVNSINSYINIFSHSPNSGNTVVRNVTLAGQGGYTGISYYSPYGTSDLIVENSVISGYGTGIFSNECTEYSEPVYSLHITNSSIGGGDMLTGVYAACGHVVVNDTIFHDIIGSALLVDTNYMSPACVTQYSSRVEVYNTTFTRISPSITAPGVVYVEAVLDGCTGVQSQTSASSLIMRHNTFADNSLASFANIAVTNGAVIDGFVVQNNAFQGRALSGLFTSTSAPVVTHNLTTDTREPEDGFHRVATLLLGALADNGGAALIGANGSGGHVLTMRPLWGSPLIDGAPDVGLTTDQRHQPRAQLRLNSYDIGAVEVSRQEVLGDGLVASQLDEYINGTATVVPAATLAKTGIDMAWPLASAALLVVIPVIFRLLEKLARATTS